MSFCFFLHTGPEIPYYLSLAGLVFGCYLISNSVIRYCAIKLTKSGNKKLLQKIGVTRLVLIVFLVLFSGTIVFAQTLSNEIISYILSSRPSKTTEAKVIAVDNGPRLKWGTTYEVTLQYTNNSDTIIESFEIRSKNYTTYWVGRRLLIRYSLLYPKVYKVIRRL